MRIFELAPRGSESRAMAEVEAYRIIAAEHADGSEAVSFLPDDHPGPCVMSYRGRLGQVWAIFPSLLEAKRAATYAIRSDIGGYADIQVHPPEAAPPDAPAYADAWTWLGA